MLSSYPSCNAACHDLSAEQYQILEMGISSISSRRPIFRFLRNLNREKIPSKRVLKDAICEYMYACRSLQIYMEGQKDKIGPEKQFSNALCF